MINTKRIRELCDAIDSGCVLIDRGGSIVYPKDEEWVYQDWTISEPPPSFKAHGRTYVLQPIPEPKKAREWMVNENEAGIIYDKSSIHGRGTSKFFKVREVLEDENGK